MTQDLTSNSYILFKRHKTFDHLILRLVAALDHMDTY